MRMTFSVKKKKSQKSRITTVITSYVVTKLLSISLHRRPQNHSAASVCTRVYIHFVLVYNFIKLRGCDTPSNGCHNSSAAAARLCGCRYKVNAEFCSSANVRLTTTTSRLHSSAKTGDSIAATKSTLLLEKTVPRFLCKTCGKFAKLPT